MFEMKQSASSFSLVENYLSFSSINSPEGKIQDISLTSIGRKMIQGVSFAPNGKYRGKVNTLRFFIRTPEVPYRKRYQKTKPNYIAFHSFKPYFPIGHFIWFVIAQTQ